MTSDKKTGRIALISVYYGNQPEYLSLFLNSAKNNPEFDFYIFSNWNDIPIKAKNIFLITFPLEDFNNLAISKNIFTQRIENPYKLCDIKPAWPHILEDYLEDTHYSHIGFSDIDLIFGDLCRFIDLEDIQNYDIWTAHDNYMAGFFTLLRNNDFIKKLYQYESFYKFIFNSPIHFAFDEILRKDYKNFSSGNNLISFSDIVVLHEKKGLLKVKRMEGVISEHRPKYLRFNKKGIFDKDGVEYMGFHHFFVKRYIFWLFPKWKEVPETFYANKYGFYADSSSPNNFYSLMFKSKNRNYIIAKIKELDYIYILKNNTFKTILNCIKKQIT